MHPTKEPAGLDLHILSRLGATWRDVIEDGTRTEHKPDIHRLLGELARLERQSMKRPATVVDRGSGKAEPAVRRHRGLP